MSIPVTGGAGFIGPRSLSDIAVRDEGKEVRPDVRPQARKNRRGIRWNTLRIFSGRERRRWSRIVRRSRTINVGQAPGFVLDWFRRQGETIINVDKLTHAVQPTPDGLAQAFIIGESFLKQDPSALVLGDNIFYGHDFHHLLGRAMQRSDGATVFAYHVHDPERYGVVEFDTQGKAVSLEENPVAQVELCRHRPVFLRFRRREARKDPHAVRTGRTGNHGLEPALPGGRHAQCRDHGKRICLVGHRDP